MRQYLGMTAKTLLFTFALLLLSIFSIILGAEETSDALKLLQQADDYFAKDNFAQAITGYEQAVKIFRQQNDRKGLADASYKLGSAYVQIGKYSEAQIALNEALKIHEQMGDKTGSGMDLTRLAVVDFNQGNYKNALILTDKALELHKSVSNQKGIADTLRLIATINEFQDNYEAALKYAQQASEIYQKIDDNEGIARCYSNVGGIYWKQGKLDEAMEQYSKTFAVAESANKKDLMAKTLGNMGLIHWNQGDPEKALEYYQKSNAISRELGTIRTQSINTFNIAILHLEGGEYKEAQEMYQRSLDMARELGDKGLEGVCLEGLGNVYKSFGNYDVALEYYEKAVKIAEEIGEKRAAAYALRSLGLFYSEKKDVKLALDYFQRASQMNEAIGEKRGVAIVLDCISELYLNMSKYDLALNNAEEALRIYESIGARGQFTYPHRMIALAHQGRKEYQKADIAFSKSIEFAKEASRDDDLWQSLYGKGEVLRALGKNDEALEVLKESIAVLERLRGEVNIAEQRAEYFENKIKVYNASIQLLISKRNFAEAFEYVQRSKARAFLDMLAEAKVNQENILDVSLRQRKKKNDFDLRGVQQNIQSEYEKEVLNQSKIAALVKQRNELELEYSNLILEIRKQNPLYADVQYPQPLKLSDAQALLDRETVLLEYSIGESGSWVFAITTDAVDVFEIPEQKKLADQVQKLREVLLKPEATYQTVEQSHSKYVSQAQTLYSEVIGPAKSVLNGKRRVMLAPDGALSYLPFESLLTKELDQKSIQFETLPYLVRDYDVQYVPSATVLASVLNNNYEKSDQPKQLLALADPWIKNGGAKSTEIATVRGWGNLAPLPNARSEVQKIASLYPKDQVTVFEGRQASEKNFKQADLQEYKKVHFASHGLIDEEKPEFSALVLSSDEKGSEDGYLTMREVFDLKLNADLVVLSACKTGLGKEIRGEGVTGISRAFLCAGTPSVLVSLWDVYDRSTADFMASFYKNMEVNHMDKAAALREARLQMIGSKKFSHPYYWAPFVLIGSK